MSTKHNLCLMLVCLILDMLHWKWRCNEVKLTLSNGKQGVAHLRGILVCRSSKPLVKSLFNVPFGEMLKRKKAFKSDNLFKGADDLWIIVATVRSHQTPSRGFAQHACSLQNKADWCRFVPGGVKRLKWVKIYELLRCAAEANQAALSWWLHVLSQSCLQSGQSYRDLCFTQKSERYRRTLWFFMKLCSSSSCWFTGF